VLLSAEVEAHVAAVQAGEGSSRMAGESGEWGVSDAQEYTQQKEKRENMAGNLWHSLLLLHNYVEFEQQFEGEARCEALSY
jgi:hypothetical protein